MTYHLYLSVAVVHAVLVPDTASQRLGAYLFIGFAIGFAGYLLVPAVGPARAYPELFRDAPHGRLPRVWLRRWSRLALEETRDIAERFAPGRLPPVPGRWRRPRRRARPARRRRRPRLHHRRPARRHRGAWSPAGPTRCGPRASGSGPSALRKDGRDLEITTHRAEAYHPTRRKPDVVFADAIEADLSRRDFTVNAMALSLPGPAADRPVRRGRRPGRRPAADPAVPEESFTDDPLRMLRAARFIAGYGLVPEPGAGRRR